MYSENLPHAMRHMRFIQVDTMIDLLDENIYRPLSVKAERDAIRAMILQTRGTRIVGPNQRFPEQGEYVCVSMEPMRGLLAALLHALDASEKHVQDDRHSFDDAYLSARKSMQRALEILMSESQRDLYSIYTRATFEEKYSLEWFEEQGD